MSNPGAGPDAAPPLTIGAVARLAGKSTAAIRYYEQIGLLPEPARSGGQRRYAQATVRTLAVIETGQRAAWRSMRSGCCSPRLQGTRRRLSGFARWPAGNFRRSSR